MEAEQMYSNHRNSSSFRKEQERIEKDRIEQDRIQQDQKKLKRDHPVNAKTTDLIDVNALVSRIDNNTGNLSDSSSISKIWWPTVKQIKKEIFCTYFSLL